MSQKTVVIIGGGHNALVLAWYLAKAGYKVIILEARDQIGGAACTDTTTFPCFKISTASYLVSLLLRKIVDDMELKRRGYKVFPRNPSSITLIPGDTRSLLLGPDMASNQEQIAQFSPRDAAMYPLYEHILGGLGDWMSEVMTMIPPSGPMPRSWRDIKALGRFARHASRLLWKPRQLWHLVNLIFTDPAKYLDRWFESDVLKATLLTDAMIGTKKPSGIVLLHHVMGDAGGARGRWGYVCGGMGSISHALADACKELGVEIVLGTEAQRIAVTGNNRVFGVWAKDTGSDTTMSRFFRADIVVSAVNPSITFGKLLAHEPRVNHWRKKVLARDTEGVSMKINLTLSGVPNLRAIPNGPDNKPGPQHQGTIHIAPSVEYIHKALCDHGEGRSSTRPLLEITIPSVVDDTLAPEGCHVMNIFCQFVNWQVDKEKYWHETVLPLLREYISNIDEIIMGVQILAPRDLEEMFGMIGGNIFNGAIGRLGQLGCMRPAAGIADYCVPEIQDFYISGGGTHPFGSVCGVPGYNTARKILEDHRAQVI